jgi:excisionase family DNA binding protein
MNERTRLDAASDTMPPIHASDAVGFEQWAAMLGIGTKAVLTTTETASVLRVSEKSVREGIKDGAIPSVRLGRRLLIPVPMLLGALVDGTLG